MIASSLAVVLHSAFGREGGLVNNTICGSVDFSVFVGKLKCGAVTKLASRLLSNEV